MADDAKLDVKPAGAGGVQRRLHRRLGRGAIGRMDRLHEDIVGQRRARAHAPVGAQAIVPERLDGLELPFVDADFGGIESELQAQLTARQPIGLPARLLQKAQAILGHGHVMGDRAQRLDLVGLEDFAALAGEGQRAEQPIADQQRMADVGAEPGLPQVLGLGISPRLEPLDEQRRPARCHHTAARRVEADAGRREVGRAAPPKLATPAPHRSPRRRS